MAASAAAEEAARGDRQLLAALLEVRSPREGPRYQPTGSGTLAELAQPSADEEFVSAFRTWGLDVDATPTAQAMARLRGRPAAVRTEVIAALDEWAGERRRGNFPAAAVQRLTDLATALDEPDSRRRELRAILARGTLERERALGVLALWLRPVPIPFDAGPGADRERLRRLAAETNSAREPVLGLLTLTQALRQAGDEALAERLLRTAVRARPQEVILHQALGQLLGQGTRPRWAEAVECFVAARVLRPSLGDAQAIALLRAGRTEEGLALYEQLATEQPNNPWFPFRRGCLLAEVARFRECERAFREAIRAKPNFARAHFGLGFALFAQGRAREAETAYRETLRHSPGLSGAHLNLALALAHQGRFQDAEATLRDALRYDPNQFRTYLNLCAVCARQMRFREAEAAAREAIRLKPDSSTGHSHLAGALGNQGRFREAEAEARVAVRLGPDDAEAHHNLASALAMQGRFAEAEAEFRQVLQLDPTAPDCRLDFGVTLSRLGRVQEAESVFREALRLKPDYPPAHTRLGEFLAGQRRFAEAETCFREALRLGPDHAEAHLGLGNALFGQNRFTSAETSFRETVRLQPNNPVSWIRLGSALINVGQLEEAEQAFRQALRLRPDDAEGYCKLAKVLNLQGWFPESLEAYRQGHALGSKLEGWNYPSAQLVQEAERLVELNRRLPAVLRGDDQPVSGTERYEFAILCRHPAKQLHAAAAYLATEAFTTNPRLANNFDKQYRYQAARNAAQAAAGQAAGIESLPDKVAATLRRQALQWLHEDLAFYAQLAGREKNYQEFVQQRLAQWQADAGLAGVRDREALAGLAAVEREAWQKLWDDVELLRRQVDGK
jgi:tetratricopeptide (TPR) repeat protein